MIYKHTLCAALAADMLWEGSVLSRVGHKQPPAAIGPWVIGSPLFAVRSKGPVRGHQGRCLVSIIGWERYHHVVLVVEPVEGISAVLVLLCGRGARKRLCSNVTAPPEACSLL